MLRIACSPRRHVALFAGGLALAVAGCSVPASVQNTGSPTRAAMPNTVDVPAGADVAFLAEHDLPAPNAPAAKAKPVGVVVAFPVATDVSTQPFASGIGYYLSGAVGGAPEFGQSPLRTTIGQIARERGAASLGLTPDIAGRVARVCGATHYLTGSYTKSANAVRLAYELRPVAPSTAAPQVFTLDAPTERALIVGLPGFAQKLRAALGAPHSAVTAAPLATVTPDVLAQIGACATAWVYGEKGAAFLSEVGKHEPLAAELALFLPYVRATPAQAAPYVALLLRTEPVNTQTLGALGYAVPTSVPKDAVRNVYALANRYADNYAISHTGGWLARASSDHAREAAFCARCPKNAPGNPDAHLTAGASISNQADRVRRGRQYRDIDATSEATITPLYAAWQAQVEAATLCDPLGGKAWQRLAMAATFAGDRAGADAAMTTARKLNVADPFDTYEWALQMYQPKWGGDPAMLQTVATEAANAQYQTPEQNVGIYKILGQGGFAADQTRMGDRIFAESAAAIAKNPNDNVAHYLHGWISSERGDRAGALADFEANVRIFPKDAAVSFELGTHLIEAGRFAEAEARFRTANALRPRNAETLYYLGYCLKRQSKRPEAQKMLQASLALAPDYAPALASLGTVYGEQNRTADAIRCFEHALRLAPFLPEANVNLAACYNATGREKETIALGEQFLRYYPNDPNMPRLVAEAKQKLKPKP